MINSFNRGWIFSLALSLMTITCSLSAQDCTTVGNNLISNCSFETGSLSPWTSTGTVAVVLAGGQQGSNYARLTAPARIDQSFSLVSGFTYNYSFWYNNTSGAGSFNMRLNSNSSIVVGPINLTNSAGVWTQIQGSFVPSVSGSYAIGFLTASSPILNIDNVIVALAIPEPASLLLLGTMASAVLGYRLKNRKIRE